MQVTVFRADRRVILRRLVSIGLGTAVLIGWTFFEGVTTTSVLVAAVIGALLMPRLWRIGGHLADRDVLTLTDEGLTDRSYGLGFVPWSNIQGVQIKEAERMLPDRFRALAKLLTAVAETLWKWLGLSVSRAVIELTLHDEEQFFSGGGFSRTMIRQGRAGKGAGLWIYAGMLEASPEDVVRAIRNCLDSYQQQAAGAP